MEDKRFYVIVPQTVQVVHKGINPHALDFQWSPEDSHHPHAFEDTVESFPMVHGRLMAQSYHVGRILGYIQNAAKVTYRDTTAITLAVRNSKELTKVSRELKTLGFLHQDSEVFYQEFYDHNPGFYNTQEGVHTITVIGPVTREEVDEAIGHLELY